MPGTPWLTPLLIAALWLYILLGALVVCCRLQYERRRRLFERVAALSDADPVPLLDGASIRQIERGLLEAALPDAALRACATYLLARKGEARVVAAASGPARRWKRVRALRMLAFSRHPLTWPLLGQAVEDPDPDVVRSAVDALGQVPGSHAAALLVKALERGGTARSRIAALLATRPDDFSEQLDPLLDASDATLRYWAVMLAARFPEIPHLERRLAAATTDADARVRRAALRSLAATGFDSSLPSVLARLDDPVPFVRAHAGVAAALLGGVSIAPVLVARLSDSDWGVRDALKRALESLGPPVEPAVFEGLGSSDEFARNTAAEILQNLGTFERLLVEEAGAQDDGARLRRIAQLADAGGLRVWDAVLANLPADTLARIGGLLRRLGDAPASDGMAG